MSKVEILFQNKDFIAVNKAPGISVHNNEDPENLLIILEKQMRLTKLFPVHRLDKETSGIQVLALHSEAASTISEEFQKRSVKKIYTGVLRGQLKAHAGSWTKALTDKAEGRKNPEGSAKDRIPCETKFKVIKANQYFSYCEFDLITGRQHQIRKHTAIINHALLGDPRYGDPKYNERMAGIYKNDRMFLHCTKLELMGQMIISPTPDEFEKLVQS